MKITRVQYTVKPEYVEQNKANIEAVMKEVRSLDVKDFKYATYLMPDGKSFMHFAIAETEEANARLLALPSFKHFSEALKASQPEVSPKSENPSLVAAGYDIF
jgi:hypothetical protein